jgi:hypothetical protein
MFDYFDGGPLANRLTFSSERHCFRCKKSPVRGARQIMLLYATNFIQGIHASVFERANLPNRKRQTMPAMGERRKTLRREMKFFAIISSWKA